MIMNNSNDERLDRVDKANLSAIIGQSFVSSYTGPEIDLGITKAYQAEYTYVQTEETLDPVKTVRDELGN